MKSKIEVICPVLIELNSAWGPGCTLGEVVRQAKEQAIRELKFLLEEDPCINEDNLSLIRDRSSIMNGSVRVKIVIEESRDGS